MTSVAKDRTRLTRIYPKQNHCKHHTPGLIINYLIFYCIHFLHFHLLFYNVIKFYPFLLGIHILFFSFVIFLCDYILSCSLFFTIIPGVCVWCLQCFWLG